MYVKNYKNPYDKLSFCFRNQISNLQIKYTVPIGIIQTFGESILFFNKISLFNEKEFFFLFFWKEEKNFFYFLFSNKMSSVDPLKPVSSCESDKRKKLGVWMGMTSFFLAWAFLYIVFDVFSVSWCCTSSKDCKNGSPHGKDDDCTFDKGRAFAIALAITIVGMLIFWLVSATSGVQLC